MDVNSPNWKLSKIPMTDPKHAVYNTLQQIYTSKPVSNLRICAVQNNIIYSTIEPMQNPVCTILYVDIGPFHGIRFVADRTFRDLFLSQKLFLGIF